MNNKLSIYKITSDIDSIIDYDRCYICNKSLKNNELYGAEYINTIDDMPNIHIGVFCKDHLNGLFNIKEKSNNPKIVNKFKVKKLDLVNYLSFIPYRCAVCGKMVVGPGSAHDEDLYCIKYYTTEDNCIWGSSALCKDHLKEIFNVEYTEEE